jgi:hypothetical protein
MNLDVKDLISTIQFIDIMVSRGAIRGNELSQVGQLRDKLEAFIAAASRAPQQKPEPQEESEEFDDSDFNDEQE